MASRHFTVAEANAALDLVRPLTERMVERRRALAGLQERRAGLARSIAGNGAGTASRLLGELATEIRAVAAALARCVEEIHGLGAQVKDIDRGLVDFPALRGGETVLLCWRLGEDAIEYWHDADEGFAGRRSLPL